MTGHDAPERVSRETTGRLVDLTLLLAEELPCWWSTHMPYQQKTFNYFSDQVEDPSVPRFSRTGPYQTRWLLIDEHTGTHLDAPAHFIPPPGSGLANAGPPGEVTVDRVPLEQLSGPAVVIRVPEGLPDGGPGVSPTIDAGLVEEFEHRHGAIEPGTIVLFHTGWDRYYRPGADGSRYCSDALVTKSAPGWPAPDVPTMEALADRGIRCVGTDGPSMGSAHDGGPVHVAALSREMVFIEALCGLHQLPERGAWFLFAPLNLARGTGAPGRAMAWIDHTASTSKEDEG